MIELKSIRHHRGHVLAVMSALLALVAVIKWTTGAVYAVDSVRSTDERIITIHDGGEQKGIVTTARTLREALQQVGVRIDSRDITEPGLDEPLVASSYEANIYRARPVVVKDGAKTTRVISAYRTAKQIAKQAGLTLNEADTASLMPSQNIIEDGVAEVLTIDRATPVTLTFYGKTIQTSTRAATVGEMLTAMRIIPAPADTLVPAANTPIKSGMDVQLWRNGIQTVTVDEDITFTTRKVNDANHESGYREVQTQGVNGRRTVTYEIIMRDGVEVEREAISSVTTTPAIEQVEVVGTKLNLPAGSHTDWLRAAGVPESDLGYANFIIDHENRAWDPCKRYGGIVDCAYTGNLAYGIPQALPGSKMSSAGPDWQTNPITQIKWMNGYVQRYGGWEGAYQHWLIYRSY